MAAMSQDGIISKPNGAVQATHLHWVTAVAATQFDQRAAHAKPLD
jgi:hypothetical protein